MSMNATAKLDTMSRDLETGSGNLHEPWQSEDVDGWLHSEEGVPSESSNREDRADDVEIHLCLGIRPGKQTQLE
jgi:hypothetical protein